MSAALQFEVGRDGIATLRPASGQPLSALDEALTEIEASGSIGGAVIVLNGDLVQPLPAGATATAVFEALMATHALLRRLETGKPIAAAIGAEVHGAAVELALACRHRVLADDAALSLPAVHTGTIPGAGATQRVPRLAGIAAALPLLLGGHAVTAAQALQLGLVHGLAPRTAAADAAHDWVRAQLALPADQREAAPWDRKGWRLPGGAGALAPHATTSFGLGVAQVRRRGGANEAAALTLLAAVYEGTQLPIGKALALEAKVLAQLATR